MQPADRAIGLGQPDETPGGNGDNCPCGPGFKQDRAENDLQKVERDERIGRAATEIELRGQGRYVEQQFHEQGRARPILTVRPAVQADDIERAEKADDAQQLRQR